MQVTAIAIVAHMYYYGTVNTSVSVFEWITAEPEGYCLLIHPRAAGDVLMRLTGHLAMQGRVNILDAALRFDVHRVARLVRQQSVDVSVALERIELVRVFNACQLLDGLRAFERDRSPILLLGALALFETDLLGSQRERRLLHDYLALLYEFGKRRMMFVATKSAERLGQTPWDELVLRAARVYDLSPVEEKPSAQQLDLFGGHYG
jgi:hypothetical protein